MCKSQNLNHRKTNKPVKKEATQPTQQLTFKRNIAV